MVDLTTPDLIVIIHRTFLKNGGACFSYELCTKVVMAFLEEHCYNYAQRVRPLQQGYDDL